MVRIRFKKKDEKAKYVEAEMHDYDNGTSTNTTYVPENQPVVYNEPPKMRLLKKQEVEKIVKDLRQRLLGLGFRARVKIKGSGLILNYLRLREAKPYTEPYQNSNYRIRDEFGIVWIDDMRDRKAKTKKARKLNFLQYREWQAFKDSMYNLASAHSLRGSCKVGSKRAYRF